MFPEGFLSPLDLSRECCPVWGDTIARPAVLALVIVFLSLATPGFVGAQGQTAAQQVPPTDQSYIMVGGVPEHKFGRNDRLRITVWNGLAVEEVVVRVAEDGTIFVPFGVDDNFKVEGLSSTELKRVIREELLQYFRESVVQVVIEEYNSNRAYLLGEVLSGPGAEGPGLYPLEGRKRVLEFIIEHGGFGAEANVTTVQLNRADGEVVTLNLSDVMFQGDVAQNVVVNPGDIVWVPSIQVGAHNYYVFGEVRSPGVVTTQDELNIVEVISLSGSFTADASRDSVYIARGDLNQPEIIALDFKSLMEEADFSQNVVLQENDVVFVARRGLAKARDIAGAVAPFLGLLRDTVFISAAVKN